MTLKSCSRFRVEGLMRLDDYVTGLMTVLILGVAYITPVKGSISWVISPLKSS